MNILIVTHWFYPRQIPRAFRAFELMKELKKEHEVDVLIGDWKLMLNNKDNYTILDKYSTNEVINKNASLSNKRFIQCAKKLIEYFAGERYLLTSGRYIRNNLVLDGYDLVISIGLPFYVHWMVSNAIKRYRSSGKKCCFISDWGDPFVGDSARKIAPYFTSIQKSVCRSFDYISIPTKQAIKYYREYVPEEKIKVIPQGFDFSSVYLDEYKKNRIPHFAYAGIFYKDKRNPEKFLEYLSTLKEEFVFTIYTIKHGDLYQDLLLKYEKKLGSKLIIEDMKPRLECIRLLGHNEFLINIDNTSSIQVPSKLIDYTLCNRPILSFTQDAIPVEAFNKFLKGDYSLQTEIDIDNYDIHHVAERFLELVD